MSTATVRNSGGKPAKQPPEKKIGRFAGGVGVCIWINRIETEQGPRSPAASPSIRGATSILSRSSGKMRPATTPVTCRP